MRKTIATLLSMVLMTLFCVPSQAFTDTLLDQNGVKLTVTNITVDRDNPHIYLEIEASNSNDFAVRLELKDAMVDGNPVSSSIRALEAHEKAVLHASLWAKKDDGGAGEEAIRNGFSLDMQVIAKNGETREEVASGFVLLDLPRAKGSSAGTGNAATAPASSVSVSVGDHITFGTYEQDGNANDGVEPIEWQVLDIVGNKAFVVSYYGLMNEKYCYHSKSQTWDDSDLRATLNNSFYYESFTPAEREAIQLTHVENSEAQGDPGMESRRGYGIDTEDYIYILSYAELVRYMPTQNDRVAPITNKFLKKGLSGPQKMLGMRTCNYWLRHPVFANNAGGVSWQGIITSAYMNFPSCMVRPCCWVDLTALGY